MDKKTSKKDVSDPKLDKAKTEESESSKTTKIGKYEIISKLKQGGMGAVYKAKHPTLNHFVLIKKLLLKGNAAISERFRREARLMIDFNHDHIVKVFDHFKEGYSYYIVAEYVDGFSLEDLLKKERYLPNDVALLIFYETCKALKYTHDKNVVHRDIKPGNVLISRKGEVKLIDFGIATSGDESEDGLTKEGMTLGTPSYIAPEQIKDSKSVTKKADIYSMGVMLYEMVTGKTPYPGSFTAESIALIHRGKFKNPKKYNPHIDPLLIKIIKKAMKVNPRARYQDLEVVMKKIEKRLKKHDPENINNVIKMFLFNKKTESVIKKAGARIKFVLKWAILAGVIGLAGYYLYLKGYYFEYFRKTDYGALQARVTVAKNTKDFQRPQVYASLFHLTDKGEVHALKGSLNVRLLEPKGSQYVWETEKLYLPSGNYRLRVESYGAVQYADFFLNPREVQNKLQTLEFNLDTAFTAGVPCVFNVFNIDSQRSISQYSQFYLFVGGEYISIENNSLLSLVRGKEYRFKIEREGYYQEIVSITPAGYQTKLALSVFLIPRAGTLTVRAENKKLSYQLNGSDFYLAGGKDRSYQHLPAMNSALELTPGDYEITVKASEDIKKSQTVRIAADTPVTVVVSFDTKKKELNLSVK